MGGSTGGKRWPLLNRGTLDDFLQGRLKNGGGTREDLNLLTSAERNDLAEVCARIVYACVRVFPTVQGREMPH